MILPISIKETSSKTIYRKSPKSEKTIIEGVNSSGIEEFSIRETCWAPS